MQMHFPKTAALVALGEGEEVQMQAFAVVEKGIQVGLKEDSRCFQVLHKLGLNSCPQDS